MVRDFAPFVVRS